MCGRITQRSGELPGLVTIVSDGRDSRIKTPPRYHGAPGQEHWVIRQNPETGERTRDLLWWGLIPNWTKTADGGRKPINAKAETVPSLPSFRDAYQHRRCLLPIDNFFEWKAIKGAKTKQPYAIAMQSGEPFALAGIWENWKRPSTGEWVRTFCVITCPANELVADIHNRMPVIIPPESYDHWLSTLDPDPHGLLEPFPAAVMRMWPISTRVNKPENDDEAILERVAPLDEQSLL